MMGKNKRFCLELPRKMHNKIWKISGKFKINLVVQCLILEYMTDEDLQARVKSRLLRRSRKTP